MCNRVGMVFSEAELAYLSEQRIGRPATADARGRPQANPTVFLVRDDGAVDIGGLAMGATKKWRNVASNPYVSLVVDDIASVHPWRVRGVQIRGRAEQVTGPHEYGMGMSEELIRVHPHRIVNWGMEGQEPGMHGRAVRPPGGLVS
jgi:pyridoxamine 5'-phosphate oxidase family protein